MTGIIFTGVLAQLHVDHIRQITSNDLYGGAAALGLWFFGALVSQERVQQLGKKLGIPKKMKPDDK